MMAQSPARTGGQRAAGSAGGGRFPAREGTTALLAMAGSMAEASAAVQAGAEFLDLGNAAPDAIAAVKARYPGVLVCAASQPADAVRDVAAARATGALLICSGIDDARASALPADRLLVDVPPGLVHQARQAGWAALVDADRAAALAAGREPADAGTADSAGKLFDTGAESSGGGHERAGEDPAGIVAIAAIGSWLGAAVIRTRHPIQVRLALDMAASIRGVRPPARAIRGLA